MMNVINGIDIPAGPGHNRGGRSAATRRTPSIDQVLAGSAKFYPNGALQPAIVRNLVSLSKTSSGIVQTQETAGQQHQAVRPPVQDHHHAGHRCAGTQPVLVDSVREHAALVKADPRCSADCRTRLDEYLTHAVGGAGQGAAGREQQLPRPTVDTRAVENTAGFYGQPENHAKCEQLWNDIVVAAFTAGITRVYVCGPTSYTFGPEPEHVAQQLCAQHRGRGIEARGLQRRGAAAVRSGPARPGPQDGRGAARPTAARCSTRASSSAAMNSAPGGSPGNHHNRCIPIVSFGSAGGFFKTGQSLDYRDVTSFVVTISPTSPR